MWRARDVKKSLIQLDIPAAPLITLQLAQQIAKCPNCKKYASIFAVPVRRKRLSNIETQHKWMIKVI